MSYKKHPLSSFLRELLITSAVIWLIALYPVYLYVSSSQLYSSFAGFALSLLNALSGYMINNFALKQSVRKFMLTIFGGMCIRLLILLAVLGLIIRFTTLDSVYLISSLFLFYIVFISIEILNLHRIQKTIN